MATKTFAAWVEPYARQLSENRAEVVAFARSVPAEAWDGPSPLDGWSYKDILAHIGKGNDQLFQKLLRTVVADKSIDTAIFAEVDTDGENARGVQERRSKSAEELIEELEEGGKEIQTLLSHLTEEQQRLRQEEPLFLLEGFLQGVCKESHDIEHLTQLRTAVEAG